MTPSFFMTPLFRRNDSPLSLDSIDLILAEFRSVVNDTKSNTKNITKSISIHSDYQSVHFW